MATQPNLIKRAWAENGAAVPIPETTTSLGVASLSQGFPTETELPLANGGVPPRRVDFNGAFQMLSLFAIFQQSGGVFAYSAEVKSYDPPCIVYYNGDLWWCLQQNGSAHTVVTPGTDNTVWIKFRKFIASPLDAYPVGTYFTTNDSRNPADIFAEYGPSTWEQVKDRVIVAKGDKFTGSAGTYGGNQNASYYGQVKLVVDNLPSHNHSCGNESSHTHLVKGTTASSGEHHHGVRNREGSGLSGRMAETQNSSGGTNGMNTSDNGEHTHSINFTSGKGSAHNHAIGSTGKGTAFSIMPPYVIAYVWRRTG